MSDSKHTLFSLDYWKEVYDTSTVRLIRTVVAGVLLLLAGIALVPFFAGDGLGGVNLLIALGCFALALLLDPQTALSTLVVSLALFLIISASLLLPVSGAILIGSLLIAGALLVAVKSWQDR